jgi:RNA polymerase sigma-70 factor (ECF subfamily)
MTAAQNGDRDAYRKLLEDVSAAIRAFLLAKLGDVPLLDDCTQECLLGIHRARHTYDPARAFRPWLFAIVRHKAVDALRRGSVRERREIAEAPEALSASESPGDLRDRTLDAERALVQLETGFREALVMTKFQGYSIDEAASRAGVSSTAMKTRVHRALRKVRRLLEEPAP